MSIAELKTAAPSAAGRRGPVILVIGFCLFAIAQISLTVTPLLERPNPPWPADALMYMAKAIQVRDCFRQDCQAMEALQQQLTAPTDDPEMKTKRDRQYHRSLYQYHLLHSFVLERLERITGDWEGTYRAIAMVGGVTMVLAITAFMVTLYGPAAAGVGLALLSTTVFPGFHGIHWIVPSNMTLAVGFIAWTLLLRRDRIALPALPLLVLVMVSLHTVGQIYAGTAVLIAAYVSFRRGPVPWLFIGLSGVILVGNALLPSLVERPALSLLREQLPADVTWWQAIIDNVIACWEHADEFGAPFHGPDALLCLMVLGLLTMRGRGRADATFLAVLFGGLCVAGALYVMPHYPAEVFRRVWIPFVVLALGAVGALACGVMASIRALMKDRPRYARGSAGVFVLTALVFGGGLATVLAGVPDVMRKYVALRTGSVFELDHGQPGRILASMGPDQGLVYMHEVPMFTYLLHGGLERNAVFYPAVEGTPDADALLRGADDLTVAVATHPSDFVAFHNGIWLPREGDMRIDTGGGPGWTSGAIRIKTLTKPVEIEAELRWPSGKTMTFQFEAPPKQFTWVDLPPAAGATSLTLRHTGGGFSRVAGIRLDRNDPTQWPWDRGVTVFPTPHEDNEETEVRFESLDLVPEECESGGVLDDVGGTIVVALRCGGAQAG